VTEPAFAFGEFGSWGRVFAPQEGAFLHDHRDFALPQGEGFLLAHGCGRSYGDSCLNHGHRLIATRRLSRFISFDAREGIVACEAGVTLDALISLVLPRGWFPPVVPGTRWVTVGGAIANDIHGKNHHRTGSFGHHVRAFELLRSGGERVRCSAGENADLFRATIGGLGLTGLITWAELALERMPGPWLDQRPVRFRSLAEFFDVDANPANDGRYVVSWVDAMSAHAGRGIYFVAETREDRSPYRHAERGMPIATPISLVTRFGMKAFNALYYARPRRAAPVGIHPFFFSLDALGHWNRLYGPRGFFQYQCVVGPGETGRCALERIFGAMKSRDRPASLAVLKRFGDHPRAGMLSFPMAGYTLALDFANRNGSLLSFFEELDAIVLEAGGRLYGAKDGRMSPAMFAASYPQWRDFARHVDPAFSSSFWRRVTQGEPPHYAHA
jgi:FAD/FMN-containing dehydrogenase